MVTTDDVTGKVVVLAVVFSLLYMKGGEGFWTLFFVVVDEMVHIPRLWPPVGVVDGNGSNEDELEFSKNVLGVVISW